jgi:hypothetical protein
MAVAKMILFMPQPHVVSTGAQTLPARDGRCQRDFMRRVCISPLGLRGAVCSQTVPRYYDLKVNSCGLALQIRMRA